MWCDGIMLLCAVCMRVPIPHSPNETGKQITKKKLLPSFFQFFLDPIELADEPEAVRVARAPCVWSPTRSRPRVCVCRRSSFVLITRWRRFSAMMYARYRPVLLAWM